MNKTIMCRLTLCLLLVWTAEAGATGQSAPPVKGMASTVGLYVYPRNRQSATQQLTDESQCYSNAEHQTGYNPNATTTATNTKAQDQKSGDKPMAQGAVRGAVISGATGGDAAAGTRRGAILGGIKAKRKDKQETAQENKAAAATTAQQQTLDNFKRSLSACLDARGYSVK
jgi:hypothetical protein